MIHTCVDGILKLYGLEQQMIEYNGECGHNTYTGLLALIESQFPKKFKINANNLIQWQEGTLEIKEFFNYVKLNN